MKKYSITYYLMPDAENIEITISANSYEDACVYAKDYRREGFSVKEITSQGKEESMEEKKIIVTDRASRYNEDDRIDFDALAEQAEINGGYAQYGIYCAKVSGDTIYICTESEMLNEQI